jgi:Rieske Fe-S protein
MPHSLPQLSSPPSATKVASVSDCSRRTFLSVTGATALGLLAQACGDGGTGPGGGVVEPPPAGSTSFVNGVVTLQLSLIPALNATNGHQVLGMTDGIRRADLVIIKVGTTFRAFSSICTHEGCIVTGFSNQRMVCPCHGSEFNASGQPVAGPAPAALREFPVTLNATAQTLTIAV